jgi:nuclear cap-binding protein subunit 2
MIGIALSNVESI